MHGDVQTIFMRKNDFPFLYILFLCSLLLLTVGVYMLVPSAKMPVVVKAVKQILPHKSFRV